MKPSYQNLRGERVLFHRFASQEERRRCGGSAFLEIQFCRLPAGTPLKELVAVDQIRDWQNDSLYVADENTFYREYGSVFDCGVYNNLECGPLELYGINYYAPALTDPIIERLRKDAPPDYEVLVTWLIQSKKYHGFYILGL